MLRYAGQSALEEAGLAQCVPSCYVGSIVDTLQRIFRDPVQRVLILVHLTELQWQYWKGWMHRLHVLS